MKPKDHGAVYFHYIFGKHMRFTKTIHLDLNYSDNSHINNQISTF